ncbi:MAG: hypothetical protein Q8880_00820 [Bacteroidota bacterium]|nr:hypothetical protein [Bacteroidota bacterium]
MEAQKYSMLISKKDDNFNIKLLETDSEKILIEFTSKRIPKVSQVILQYNKLLSQNINSIIEPMSNIDIS